MRDVLPSAFHTSLRPESTVLIVSELLASMALRYEEFGLLMYNFNQQVRQFLWIKDVAVFNVLVSCTRSNGKSILVPSMPRSTALSFFSSGSLNV